MALTKEQVYAITVLARISSSIGVLGSLLTLCFFYKRQQKHKLARHLVFVSLCTCELIGGIAVFCGYWAMKSTKGCIAQGFFIHFSLAVILWQGALATDMLLRVIFRWSDRRTWRLMPFYFVVCLGFPVLSGLVLAILGMYTRRGPWCYIGGPQGPYLRLWLFLIFLLAMMVYLCVVVVILSQAIAKNRWKAGQTLSGASRRAVIQVWLYCIVFLAVWTPTLVIILHDAIEQSKSPPLWLWCLSVTLAPIQGALTFFIYVGPLLKQETAKGRSQAAASLVPTVTCVTSSAKSHSLLVPGHAQKGGLSSARVLISVGEMSQTPGKVAEFGVEKPEKGKVESIIADDTKFIDA